tara:strand:- start:1115 stop:2005 length:891 start_codon:yes stop_codon:yes gene_type:complete
MAINFLDAITVNSGTGSASTIVATGARPVTIKGGGIGSVAIGGSNGGWATGYFFTGYSGTNRGGFGALGNVDSLSYYYIGDAYNDTTMVVQPNAGNVGIGTTTPATKLDVNGDTIVRGNVGINGATSIDSPLDIAAASTGNNALLTKWYYSPNAETYNLQLKQTVTSGVVRYNFSMVNNSTAYNDVFVLDRGKIGIGTTNPTSTLQVNGTFTSSGISNIGIGANTSVYLTASSGTGKVGVGTTSPAEKLDVNGNVKATGYKTSSGTGVTANVTVRNQNNSGTKTFQIVGGIIVGIT